METINHLLHALIAAIVRAFFPAVIEAIKESARDTAEDVRPQPELKARLQSSIRGRFGRPALAGGTLALACLLLAGCGNRAIFVPDGEVVRLRETIKNAPIWVMGANGNLRAAKMDLPAGWYCLADPGADQDAASELIMPPR